MASLLLSACGGGGGSNNPSAEEESALSLLDTTMQYEQDEEIETEEAEYENAEISPSEEENKTQIDFNTSNDIILAKQEPYYKYAWHIDSKNSILNSKGYEIDEHADINLTEAWKLSMGEGIKVAIIDDGGEVNHEELQENLFKAYNADDGSNDVDVDSEEGSHGNTCAGFIVSAINGKGTVGVAPKAELILIRQEELSDANTIKAFEYAKEQGAKIISCSWGTNDISDIMVSELKSLYEDGITTVFASGNEGRSLDQEGINDESEVEWVIGVGSSVENNDVGSYSNYGKNIDLLAPGGDTFESSGLLGIDNMGEIGSDNQLDLVNNNYQFTDGTSFATPIVAGVVTLMYAVNPNIQPNKVREILIQTATKIGQGYDNNGFEEKRAYGKINAGLAVQKAKVLSSNR